MSSIPLIWLAKTLTAATVVAHPAAAQGPVTYTVKAGDTLSVIAAHTYKDSGDWPAIWYANRRTVANPNVISVGEKLQLPASGKVSASVARAAEAAAGSSASSATVSTGSTSASSSAVVESNAPI